MKLVWLPVLLLIPSSPLLLNLCVSLYHKSLASSYNHVVLFLVFHALMCAILVQSNFKPCFCEDPNSTHHEKSFCQGKNYEDDGYYNDNNDDEEEDDDEEGEEDDEDGSGYGSDGNDDDEDGGNYGSDGYEEDDDDDRSDDVIGWDDNDDDDDEKADDDLEMRAEAFIAKVISGWKEELLREKLT